MRSLTNPAVCPSCWMAFQPGVSWLGSNLCKARYVLDFVAAHPGGSAYELAKVSGFPYADTLKALGKARSLNLVRTETETRDTGGFRYRYWAHEDHHARLFAFETQLRGAEQLGHAVPQKATMYDLFGKDAVAP